MQDVDQVGSHGGPRELCTARGNVKGNARDDHWSRHATQAGPALVIPDVYQQREVISLSAYCRIVWIVHIVHS